MKKQMNSLSAATGSGKARTRTRVTITLVSLIGSIVLSLTIFGTLTAFAAGVKETPTAANPWGLAFDNAGHVWVAEPGCDAEPNCSKAFQSYIGEYNLSNESLVKNYFEPSGFSSPVFLTVKNNNIWFTQSTSNAIGELIPGSTPKWKQWKVPTASSNPYDLLFDKNGNLWFTEYTGNKIGFFNPSTKTFAETTVPTANSHPYGITMDKSGTMWFVENNAMKIASFTPTTGGKVTIKEYAVAPANNPHLITSDASGNIWYSEGFSGDIGEYIPKTGAHKNISVTPPNTSTHISGIAVDSQGRIWFDDSLSARVGYYNPTSGTYKTLTLSNANAHPYNGLGVDASNNTWFTEEFGGPTGSLGEVPAGTI